MIKLPETFNSNGGKCRLLKRKGRIALVERRLPQVTRPTWEVVRIQRHKATVIAGREIPARESMPSSQRWGTYGWTLMSLDEAESRFEALSK